MSTPTQAPETSHPGPSTAITRGASNPASETSSASSSGWWKKAVVNQSG